MTDQQPPADPADPADPAAPAADALVPAPAPAHDAPADSPAVRERLADALRLDLVGPPAGHALADERLPGRVRPSNWYLTGFLVPSGMPPAQCPDADDEDEDFDAEVPADAGLGEESGEDRKAKKKGYFPSSMGISFLVPAEEKRLRVTVRWGDYTREEYEDAAGKAERVWVRTPRAAELSVRLGAAPADRDPHVRDVPGSNGLTLHAVERTLPASVPSPHIPPDARAVSLFLVNARALPADEEKTDETFAFQAEIEVRADPPFLPRPDLRGARRHAGGEGADDGDERVADLHYAETAEYATGHGVAADWEVVDGACWVVRTAWMPVAEVEDTTTVVPPGVELSMEALGRLPDGAAASAALGPLAAAYRAWIAARRAEVAALDGPRRKTAETLLEQAGAAAGRIERGIAALAADPDALDAFRVANRAVARALRRRLKLDAGPRWRAFQLAFLLLNLPGIVDPHDADRETVDLLFFPTGGGKTEAYLGLAAFTMVLRRLRHPGDEGRAGAGVSVVMRYTLRLLTLDQLGRAAGLVCALELEREADSARYGGWPFEIGLWVGKAATPNRMGRKGGKGSDFARDRVRRFKAEPGRRPSPIPLENCPWCGAPFTPESFQLKPDADRPCTLAVACADFECDFRGDRPLPIVAVDEPLYRRLPAFLVATVDKFASLPWVGPSGALLGGADRHDRDGFYGPAEPGAGHPLAASLPPPDLVIQDELHLIAGPLGTMAGLYETAIDALMGQPAEGRTVRPKVVASTATIRRAQAQIQALFGRASTAVFPPPGPDRRDTYFARTAPAAERPARRYLGIAAPGRNPKVLMRRVLVPLMAAAERAYRDAGGHRNHDNPADPYMTVLAYFNSLRELGGARRILEEEVQNTLKEYGARRRIGETAGPFRDRQHVSEVLELTSRVSTAEVAAARRRLERRFHEQGRVDCAIATNMISVGLDIARLGLMVVLGQPKTHAEYIQATSRVGRDHARPGLILTLLNLHKPRDRSHHERFRHYHETFYRAVEAGSVTPFAARALDRGLAGALVTLARHGDARLTPADGAGQVDAARADIEPRLLRAFDDRLSAQPLDPAEREECRQDLDARIRLLLADWKRIVDDYRDKGIAVEYQKHERQPKQGAQGRKPLLREMLDTTFDPEVQREFRTNRSLRDVEPEVILSLRDLGGGGGA